MAESLQESTEHLSLKENIYLSGYSDDLVAAREIFAPDDNFLRKPVSLTELSNKVRHTIDG